MEKLRSYFGINSSNDRYSKISQNLNIPLNLINIIVEYDNNNHINQNIISEAHKERITCLIVLSDTEFISGSDDFTIKIWQIYKNDSQLKTKCIDTLIGHTGVISQIILDKSRNRIISASFDQTIKIWNIITKQIEYTLIGHNAKVTVINVLPDGKIISGSDDKTLILWSTNGNKTHVLNKHRNRITDIIVLFDNYFVSRDESGRMIIWTIKPIQENQSESHIINGTVLDDISCKCNPNIILFPDGCIGYVISNNDYWDATYKHIVIKFNPYQNTKRVVVPLQKYKITSLSVIPYDSTIKHADYRIISKTVDGSIKIWYQYQFKNGHCSHFHVELDKYSYNYSYFNLINIYKKNHKLAVLNDKKIIDIENNNMKILNALAGIHREEILEACFPYNKSSKILPSGDVDDSEKRLYINKCNQLASRIGTINNIIVMPTDVIITSSNNSFELWDKVTGNYKMDQDNV